MSNIYFQDFKQKVLDKHRNLRKTSFSQWIEANTYLGKSKFKIGPSYRFQEQIINDSHPFLVGIKLSQVGFTEIQIRKALAFLHKYDGTTLIYTLPDLKMQKQVSATRLKPLVNSSPMLEKKENETRTSEIYQFGSSFLHCALCGESTATSIPADFIMIDELDLSDPEMVALLNSRLQNSDFKIKQRFSTPTFFDYGVDADYNLSDQHDYVVKCEHCNHVQAPDYDWRFVDIPGRTEEMEDIVKDITDLNVLNLDLENAKVVCEKCRKPLNLLGNRWWQPNFPSRKNIRGYKVRPFTTDRLPISYITMSLLDYKRKQKLRRGVNTVLGRPFEDGESRLYESDIRECLKGENLPLVGKDTPVFLGCDIGLICHLTLGIENKGKLRVIKVITIPHKILRETMKVLRENYNIVQGCTDRYPYTPLVEDIRDDSNGVIVPVAYSGDRSYSPKKQPNGEQLDYYDVSRTFMADLVAEGIKKHELEIYGYTNYTESLVEHLRNMVRDERPDQAAVWRKIATNDHFFHSLIYLHAAFYIKNNEYTEESTQSCIESVVQTIKTRVNKIY